MKKNYPVTQKEFPLDENSVLVSTTDLKGITTYANEEFCRCSGFSQEELIGKSHNIVRHPDMPPEAFEDLWKNLKQGKPWLGVVKNRRKDGDHYWVNAFVAPLYQEGEIVAYQSVRTKPRREWVERAEAAYKAMNEGKNPPSGLSGNLHVRLFALTSGCLAIVLAALSAAGSLPPLFAMTGLAGGVFASWLSSRWLAGSLRKIIARECDELAQDKLRLWIYTGRCDELGQLLLAKLVCDAKAATVRTRVVQYAHQLIGATRQAASVAEQTGELASRQRADTNQLANAMEQMVNAVNKVAENVGASSHTVEKARESAQDGKEMVTATMQAFRGLVSEVDHSSETINTLAEESEQINALLDVIRSISDQTNLLALNAAIEAARAGEHGRGFAVVADEVRSLAANTQKSAQEIYEMINRLQQRTRDAVAAMERAKKNARTGAEQAKETENVLESITEAVSDIATMAHQIAGSTKHQQATAEEIHDRISSIRDQSDKTAQDSEYAVRLTREVSGLSKNLEELVVYVH